MTWKLENVEMRAKENPETFIIPEPYERKGLEPGMFARLIFLQKDSGERMWVEVKRRLGPGRYEGVLANNPVVIDGLEFGQILKFEAKNVADITDRSQMPGHGNHTMNGMFDAFEIWKSDAPEREIVADENSMWFWAAPEEVKARSRGRSSSPLRPRDERGMERSGYDRGERSESPKDWSPMRSRFGSRPSSRFSRPPEEGEGY